MKPYKLDLSQFGDKLRDRIDFTISNVSDEKVEINMIDFAHDYFDVSVPKSIGAGKTAKGSLKLKKEILKQNFEKSFTIETNDSKNSRFTIPVKRQVRQSTQASTKSTK